MRKVLPDCASSGALVSTIKPGGMLVETTGAENGGF